MQNLLKEKKTELIEGWIRATLADYPADAAKFYRNEKDPFANPVGTTIVAGIGRLFDALIDDAPPPELAQCLDGIIRVRSVQELAPSQAVSFVFSLKNILRETWAKEPENPRRLADFLQLEEKIDRMAAVAFDVYVEYQRRLFDIRIREIKSQVATLYKRSGLFAAEGEPESNRESIPRCGAAPEKAGVE